MYSYKQKMLTMRSTSSSTSGRIVAATTRTTAAVALVISAFALISADAKCSSTDGAPTVTWDDDLELLTLSSGCATMSDLVGLRTDSSGNQIGPISYFSKTNNWYSDGYTGTYYLESDLYITNGATLSIDGDDSDTRECETLLLASNSSTMINLRAHGGNLDIRNTKIFSWDLGDGNYDMDPESNGRSHISAVTEIITGRTEDTCPDGGGGNAKFNMGSAHMDIYRSEIGYLGYQGGEAYGVSYKARGLCNDLSNLDIYDDDQSIRVGVTGDITRSELHHNWYGHYSWAHDGGIWRNNKLHDNYLYGFDPHDDSDHLKIIGNEVYFNGKHGIIASKRCNNVVIRHNKVYNNGGNGIMLHRSSDDAIVRNNNAFNNADAGLAIFESSSNRVYDNAFRGNKYGVRFSNGSNKNRVYSNTIRIEEDGEYAIYMYKGSDPQEAEGNEDGHNKYNRIYSNNMYSEKERLWKISQADYNTFRNNDVFSGEYASFEDAEGNSVRDNEFPADFYFEASSNSCFKEGGQATPAC